MTKVLPAMVAGLGVLASVTVLGVMPTAGAYPYQGYGGGCPDGYQTALHLDRGPVCATPSVIDGNGVVNGVSAFITPPAPGQPLRPNVFIDTNLPPCYQVSPEWPCTIPWLFRQQGPAMMPLGY